MLFERKTKDQSWVRILVYPIGTLLIFFFTISVAGFGPAFYVMGSLFLIASVIPFVTFWRTRNTGFLAVALFQVIVCLVCVSAPPVIEDRREIGLIPIFLVGMYILMLVWDI